jgi:hypothetical protein
MSLPLFPKNPPRDLQSRPTNLKHVSKNIMPALHDTKSALGTLILSTAGEAVAKEVMRSMRIWRISTGGMVEEDPYGIDLLDRFGVFDG